LTVFAKDTTYGLEVPVLKMQNLFESDLPWIGTNNIYGIAFEAAKEDNIVLTAWVNEGINRREQPEIFNNDKVTSVIGFLPISRDVISKVAIVQIICTIDLEKAYNANVRDNERAYLEFQNIIEQRHKVSEGGFKRGIDDVFAGFRTDNIKYLDMQPFDCFSFEVEMSYPNNPPCQ
jgi:hypothetical protein